MRSEIKKTAMETPTAVINSATFNKITPTNLHKYKILLKVGEKFLSQSHKEQIEDNEIPALTEYHDACPFTLHDAYENMRESSEDCFKQGSPYNCRFCGNPEIKHEFETE